MIPQHAALDRMAQGGLEKYGVPVVRLDDVRNRWQLALLARTFAFLSRHRRSVLHVHHVWPAGDRYLVPLAHVAGVRGVIVTEHLVGYAHSPSQRWLKRWELHRADQVVGVSRAVTGMLERDYEFDAARGRVIENGVDAAGLDRSQARAREERARVRTRLGAGEHTFAWVFVGWLEGRRGSICCSSRLRGSKPARRRDSFGSWARAASARHSKSRPRVSASPGACTSRVR